MKRLVCIFLLVSTLGLAATAHAYRYYPRGYWGPGVGIILPIPPLVTVYPAPPPPPPAYYYPPPPPYPYGYNQGYDQGYRSGYNDGQRSVPPPMR